MSTQSTALSDHEAAGPGPVSKSRPSPTPAVTVKYATIADWITISGMRRTGTYEALGRGELRAIKINNRTLIDVEHGLAWLTSLPAAEITTGRRRDAANEASGCGGGNDRV
jgi:hypothetical protein